MRKTVSSGTWCRILRCSNKQTLVCKQALCIYRSYGQSLLILNYLCNHIHFNGITYSIHFQAKAKYKKPFFLLSLNKNVSLVFSIFKEGILFIFSFMRKKTFVRQTFFNFVSLVKKNIFGWATVALCKFYFSKI